MHLRVSIMDWVPIVFVAFKLFALGIAMFFAIKWHYDQGQKEEGRAILRTGGKMAAVFVLALLGVGLFAFVLSGMLGLDLSFPS
jgi:formate-dependent nitrite reductase membrane component NrfD